jgi:hypothetical protein
MLRLILATVAVVIVAASLTSRLSEVRGADNKTGSNAPRATTGGYDLVKSKASRTTASGKHISKGVISVRKAGKGQQE